ncbi:HTTM domain-containing protein [Mycolicibacterium arenosum]|uniref:HTTM domain-containing protein n=1 Tax=Mycolicibacterium arenosum TaxID=2952157 RepID=A0ABT1LYP7_9MYCO|nr:HTTM domain-containing protein [Mycolicibacterium sp. CAU 1645]MCP9272021.1 HTTM domain-containing protein [Mycolicibacterium sp. CAU 1645]
MNSPMTALRVRAQAGVAAWRGFWFTVQPAYTLGIVRMAFGVLVFFWALEVGRDLYVRFGSSGFYPVPPNVPFMWSVFKLFPSDSALLVGWLALMIASVALIFGWHSRFAAIVVFILIFSFERRNPWIFNAGDGLIRIEALLMALSPCGAALSLDQRRRTGSFWTSQEKSLWALRLMQVQVSVIYISTVIAKLRGETWQSGTAVGYTLRLDDMLILPVPWFVSDTPVIANAMTWGTLAVEIAIGVLVWNRRWRAKVLFAGVVLHLSIMLTVVVGFFSLAMFVMYLAFVPTERAQAIADAMARRSAAFTARFRRRRQPADTPPSTPEPVHAAEPAPVFVVQRPPAPEQEAEPVSTGRHARREPADAAAPAPR